MHEQRHEFFVKAILEYVYITDGLIAITRKNSGELTVKYCIKRLIVLFVCLCVSCQLSTSLNQGVKIMKQDDIMLDPSENVEKYPSGIISSGKSLKKQTVANVEIPPKASIYFSEDGKLSGLWATENLQIGSLVFSNSYQLEFYPDKSIKSGRLTDIHTINGIEYSGLVQERKNQKPDSSWTPFITHFYNNGTVQKGFLAKNTIINGFKFMAGTEIEFYAEGEILYGKSASNQEYKGHQVYEDNTVYFHKNGMIAEIYNEWGMERFDENGMHMGHKQYLK